MKVLIFGAKGMLGNCICRVLSAEKSLEVFGTIREKSGKWHNRGSIDYQVIDGIDINKVDIDVLMSEVSPELVINCIGLIKQLPGAEDPALAIRGNSLFPHNLAKSCANTKSRLIHFSTDCVFSGERGNYSEMDAPGPLDLYGRTKLLGEIDYGDALTIRTSIIGHEISGKNGLLEWFLSQEKVVKGYKEAIFSGFPTFELSKIIRDYIIPNYELRGIFHISADSISKFQLLSQIAKVYEKKIIIEPCDEPKINRSLDSSRFKSITGYCPPSWNDLLIEMKSFG